MNFSDPAGFSFFIAYCAALVNVAAGRRPQLISQSVAILRLAARRAFSFQNNVLFIIGCTGRATN